LDTPQNNPPASNDALEHAPCGFLRFDDGGKIVKANATLCQMLGYQAAEMLALKMPTLVAGSDYSNFQNHFLTHLEQHGHAEEFDLTLQSKSGAPVTMLANGVRRQCKGGAVYECVFLRIKQRPFSQDALLLANIATRCATLKLRAKEKQFRAAFEQSAVGIGHVCAKTGRFFRMNAKLCELIGYSAAELAMMMPADLALPDDCDADDFKLGQMLRGDIPFYEAEKRYLRKDGKIIWVLVNATLLRYADGRPKHTVAIIQDISIRKLAEETITRQVREMDTLYETVPTGLFQFDADLRFVRVNAWTAAINGCSIEAHIGRTLCEVVESDHNSQVERILRQVLETGEPVCDIVVQGVSPTLAEVRVWLANYYPVRCESGKVVGVHGIVEDITERKQAEEKLRAAHHSFRQLVEHSPFGIYAVDADFQLVQVSAGAQGIFKNVRPLLGRDFAEIVRIVWPEAFASKVIAIFRQVLATGESYHVPSSVEKRRDTKVIETYDWKVERMFLPDGRLGAVCHFYDLTERQHLEARLRESETRMRMATEVAAVGIWEWNVITNLIRWDAQMFRIYGIAHTTENLVEYSDWSGAVLAEDLVENERIIQSTILGAGESRREFRILRRDDGECRTIEAVETVRLDSQGKVEWIMGTNLDITEREQSRVALIEAKNQAEAGSRAKDNFLAALSHELRTPLTPVLMTATALASDPTLPPEVREQLDMMRRNIELEARLIDDLLDLTRIIHGKFLIERSPADVHELLLHTYEIIRSDGLGKQLQIDLKLAAACHHTLADPARLQQVFWNLLRNAVKFTHDGGHITVSTENHADGRIIIRVADNGIGIRAEVLSNIFDAFNQGDTGLEHRYAGLGLGLAISSAIITSHHGEIKAESPGCGHGAVFTVTLNSVAAPNISRETNPLLIKPDQVLTLLVVEDHEATRTVLDRLLTHSGHRVTTVSTLADALAAFRTTHFDAVISDLGLPDGSGLDLMVQIQTIRPVPAIALSGYGMEGDLVRTRQAGFFAHLVKPVKIEQLKKLLAQLPAKADLHGIA